MPYLNKKKWIYFSPICLSAILCLLFGSHFFISRNMCEFKVAN